MKRNMSKEEKQKRIKVREFLKQNLISSLDDINIFLRCDRRALPRWTRRGVKVC